MRLDKYISESTAYSRKDIKKLIKYGYIEVNGVLAEKPEMQVTEMDNIVLDGENISYAKYVYLLLNKPQGYISATTDKHYPVVTELVPEKYSHYKVFPVGRLDIDTEGKFHQVKRMFERVGKTVTFLKRVAIGGLILPADLKPGEIIEMDKDLLEKCLFS